MVCSGKPAELIKKTIGLLLNGNTIEYLAWLKKCKSRCNRDLLEDCADSPSKFWAAIERLYPTKLPSEKGLAFVRNGSKSTDKSVIANSFWEYFSTVGRNLKSKSILLCDFTRSKPEENRPNQVTESQFFFETAKESDILEAKKPQTKESIWTG